MKLGDQKVHKRDGKERTENEDFDTFVLIRSERIVALRYSLRVLRT